MPLFEIVLKIEVEIELKIRSELEVEVEFEVKVEVELVFEFEFKIELVIEGTKKKYFVSLRFQAFVLVRENKYFFCLLSPLSSIRFEMYLLSVTLFY